VAVLPRSTVVLAGGAEQDLSHVKSDKSVSDEGLKALLEQDLWTKKGGKKR